MSTQEIIKDDQSSLKRPTHEVTTSTGRSYDCGFCKRGFTNAQALGGHMNIHRKDRAKIKANKQPTIQNIDFPRVSSVDQNPTSCYLAPLVEYRVYLPCSSNPSFQEGNICQQRQYLEEDMDVNLGLRIGGRVRSRGGDLLESEVDLELRLGYI